MLANAQNPMDIYEAWFEHIQGIHKRYPNRHPNQTPYDLALKNNYPWVFFNLRQTEIPLVLHDIGCAYGTMSIGAFTLGYKVRAFDIVEDFVNKEAFEALGIEFRQHNIEEKAVVSSGEDKADVVIFTEVLEHLNWNPKAALTNIADGMKDGGLLILSTPRKECGKHADGVLQAAGQTHWNSRLSYREAQVKPEWQDAHMYIYTESELRELMHRSGFHILTFGLAWGGMTSGIVAYKK